MAARLIRLLVALGLLLGAALPSAAAAVVRPPASQETDASPVPDRGADPVNASSYFEARYFRSGLGRFTTIDPLASSGYATNPQSWNRFTFGLNNPLRIGDPTGLEPTEYHDTNGNWLGTDGTDNGVFSLITNTKTANLAKSQQKANGQVNPLDTPVAHQETLTPEVQGRGAEGVGRDARARAELDRGASSRAPLPARVRVALSATADPG
jgi:RHS repeat-associated protein